jgi:hypothetical protein
MRLRFFPAATLLLLSSFTASIGFIEAFVTTTPASLPQKRSECRHDGSKSCRNHRLGPFLVLSGTTSFIEEEQDRLWILQDGEMRVGDTIFAGQVTDRAKRLHHRAILNDYRIQTVHGEDVCVNDRLVHPTSIVLFLRSLG